MPFSAQCVTVVHRECPFIISSGIITKQIQTLGSGSGSGVNNV